MKTGDNTLAMRKTVRLWVGVAGAALFTITSSCQSQTTSQPVQKPTAVIPIATDSATAAQTVIAFLGWYKTHIRSANQIPLVNQQAGKPYSVNLKNGDRYLAYLKSSQLLTDTYLNGWRTFFRERQEGFRLSTQTEGPPTGFDYDLVLLNQEVDRQLDSLNSLKIKHVNVTKKRAAVTFVLFDTYEFRLVRGPNQWLINKILNQSQE